MLNSGSGLTAIQRHGSAPSKRRRTSLGVATKFHYFGDIVNYVDGLLRLSDNPRRVSTNSQDVPEIKVDSRWDHGN